ncbi:sensor domain-containing protein [Streptomyces sp. 7N604]|uniref:sensor domain-containing protein n=1 Tax=Streptomyces sp. 7N604 TaxID=3457415 RepID=UPI003FD07E95
MRTRTRTRMRRALAGLLAAPLLALSAVACTGDGGDSAEGKKEDGGKGGQARDGGTEPGSGPGSGVRPLTKAELESALLRKGDISGYDVQRAKADDIASEDPAEVDRKECRPIAEALASKSSYARTATANGTLAKGGFGDGAVFQALLLSAYDDGDARRWLGELKKAVGTCEAFTGTESGGDATDFTVGSAPGATAGDESVTFSLTQKGDEAAVVVTVVRTGANTATYLSIPLSGKATAVERSVAAKQHEKLVAAAGS